MEWITGHGDFEGAFEAFHMCWWNEIVDISVGSGLIALIFFAGNTIMHILVRIGYGSKVR
jgi:hypothetical protein